MTTLGATSVLSIPATGFLCSRQYASRAILPCLDWAVSVAGDADSCVMSTFHSPLEKEVLPFLLRGKCKIVLVLGRSLYKKIPADLQQAIDEGRMLIVSVSDQKRITRETAETANNYILDHCNKLIFGFVSNGSHLNVISVRATDKGIRCKNLTEYQP